MLRKGQFVTTHLGLKSFAKYNRQEASCLSMLADKVSVALLKVNAVTILFRSLYIQACHSPYLVCIISWHQLSLSKTSLNLKCNLFNPK